MADTRIDKEDVALGTLGVAAAIFLVWALVAALVGCGAARAGDSPGPARSRSPAAQADLCVECVAARGVGCLPACCKEGSDKCCCLHPGHACTCPPPPKDPSRPGESTVR